jgi:trehalose-phosphatase
MLLTDFDGTLTPIVERPELAVLSPGVRRLLRALAQCRGVKAGIVSGRALGDLKNRVGIRGLVYAGNHGLEIDGPGVRYVSPVAEELRPVLRAIHYVLGQTLSSVKGILLEDKGLSLSIHYRQVDRRRSSEVEHIVRHVVGTAEATGKARMTSGKKVYEVRPAVDWNKGKAVRLLMKRYGKGGRRSGLVPIYLGDDATDEDAFRVVEAYGDGVTVFVGEPTSNTAARYFLESPEEVARFLETLLAASAGFGKQARQPGLQGTPEAERFTLGGLTCEADGE